MAPNGYANPNVLVETDHVASHVGDPTLRLVEVDVDTAAYDSGHIAGAVGWNWKTDLQRRPVRDIPTTGEWAALLARSGVAPDTTVILYGDNNNWFAAFAYWLFRLYGHANVRLMNGGRKKWLDESRELTTDVPAYPATTYPARQMDAGLRALRDDVRAALDRSDCALVDVRSPAECSGELLAPGQPAPRRARSAAATSAARRTFRGPLRSQRTAPSSQPRSCARSTVARALRPTSRPSPTVGSASAAPTLG